MRVFRTTAIVAATGLLATTGWAGVQFTAATTATDLDRGRELDRSVVEVWAEDDRARIEFRDGGQQTAAMGLPPEGYIIAEADGPMMYLVDPGERTYQEFDLEAVLQAVGAVMDQMGDVMKMEFTDPTVRLVSNEAAPSMLGHDVRKVVYDTSYGMSMKVMGFGMQSEVEGTTELWLTDSIDEFGLDLWLRKNPPKTGIDGLDEMIAASVPPVEGIPLKSVTIQTTRQLGRKGKVKNESTTRSEMVVEELERVDVPEELLTIPAGYTEVEPEYADLGAGDPQRKGEVEDEDDGNPLKKLKGLFGKKNRD